MPVAPPLRVLVVDDERLIADTLALILQAHGYSVRQAYSGEDAVSLAERFVPHAVVSDVVMPEMGASELSDQLLAERPGLKVLYISGYTSDEVVRRGISRQDAAFIQKPFTPEDLMRKVREVLDQNEKVTSPLPASS